jgi:hypothetical protein
MLTNPKRSVLQDWVMTLPLREQGTLLTVVRGCDLEPKFPLDSPARQLTAALRGAFMVPADPREVDRGPGCFMMLAPPEDLKPSALGHHPLHWYTHVMHASEVLAYRHPDPATREVWGEVYRKLVRSLHLRPETLPEYAARLSEDRIASGNIIS